MTTDSFTVLLSYLYYLSFSRWSRDAFWQIEPVYVSSTDCNLILVKLANGDRNDCQQHLYFGQSSILITELKC